MEDWKEAGQNTVLFLCRIWFFLRNYPKELDRELGQWYRVSIREQLQSRSWHPPVPFLLISGHVEFPFSLWILLTEACFQPGMGISGQEASWYLRYSEWGQIVFLVKGAVITVVGESSGRHKADLGLQIRKCNTSGRPKQGQATKCHLDFSEGPLSRWEGPLSRQDGPRMKGGMGVWLGCVHHCYTVWMDLENAGVFWQPFAVSMEKYTSLGTSEESHPFRAQILRNPLLRASASRCGFESRSCFRTHFSELSLYLP